MAAWGQELSDWERENAERLKPPQADEAPAPPALPLDRARLVEVELEAPSPFRFFVDPRSLSVEERVVRYVMVAVSPSGAQNITYEGLRCPNEWRIYAVGQPGGGWGGRRSAWQSLTSDARLGQYALARSYFCAGRLPIRDVAEGVAALRDGGHPGLVPGAR